jgi:hypothetical protein
MPEPEHLVRDKSFLVDIGIRHAIVSILCYPSRGLTSKKEGFEVAVSYDKFEAETGATASSAAPMSF